MPSTLAQRLLDGDRRALARGISLVEDDRPEGWELVREIYPHTGRAAVFGFTGPPGVGKSTLIGALTRVRREAGRTVGVLSIDPSSPFTQGALLGDRIRLGEHFLDPGVFIRSMANRGALGGLSEAALQTALLLDAAGRDDVFVETVGVGQAEVDIIDHADTVVLVLMPGSGDSIQALKAGVMEIPDVIVINKADHPLTDTMVREIRGVLSLANLDPVTHPPAGRAVGEGAGERSGVGGHGSEERAGEHGGERAAQRGWRVPIVRTEAANGRGVGELVERLEEHRAHILAEGHLAERRRRNLRGEVLALASARLRRRLELQVQEDAEFKRLLDEVVERRLDPASAAAALLERGT
ncbi:MAG: methylmalonyl Co-A mutase-associated GTPase MeaB [Solirubrobacteraceae bacterium]